MTGGKTLLSMLMVFVLVASMALAVRPVDQITRGIDGECQAYGFDYGIYKYETVDDEQLDVSASALGYNITIDGDTYGFDWTANPAVDGVLTKEGQDGTFVHAGGTSGTIDYNGVNAISHITFCGDEGDHEEEVPEFGIVASAVVLGLAGLFIYKRRN